MNKRILFSLALSLFLFFPATMNAQKEDAQKTKAPETRQNGLFNVTKSKNYYFFEVADTLLKRPLLMTTRFTTTPAGSRKYGGELVNQQVLYWELAPTGDLLLKADMVVNLADTLDQINRAIITSNSNPIIGMFKVESHQRGLYKIKVSNFFLSDNAAFGIPRSGRMQYGIAGMNPAASYIESIKTFPFNTEVRLMTTWGASSEMLPSAGATGRVSIGLNVSFVLLPEKPMMPRLFDPRVGYFTHSFEHYSDYQQRVDVRRHISRWRLEPKDSADIEKMKRGELVEPKKPIVYYIDPATPKRWVPYLIAGVNDWQVAFEQAGWKNAIRAEVWPDSNKTMSMEDARYSVIRYLASDIPNAYGPHVSDPRTGEILESHICWYHNVMQLVHDWYMIQAGSLDEAAQQMHFPDSLMGQLIRFVSSHEVGHTLGLRHNFGSSSTVPVDSLRNRDWVERNGHTPSIMDYARFNYVAQPEDSITTRGIFPRIGDYDRWAIEWGYRPMFRAYDAVSDHWEMEHYIGDRLKKNRRLWWGDGETRRTDPRCQTEDLGDDALKASDYGIRNLQRQLNELPDWTYSSGDIFGSNLRGVYDNVVSQFNRYIGHVMLNIGGLQYDYRTVDDVDQVWSFTPRQKQKDALDWIARNVLDEPVWLVKHNYVSRFTSDPIIITLGVGRRTVRSLCAPDMLNSLSKEYTAEDYLSDLTRLLFSNPENANRYRRELQLTALGVLILDFETSTAVTNWRAPLLQTLIKLKKKFAAHPENSHCLNMADLLERALAKKDNAK